MDNQETITDGRRIQMKSTMPSSFGDGKMSKDKELNASMSIAATQPDALTTKLQGGIVNG